MGAERDNARMATMTRTLIILFCGALIFGCDEEESSTEDTRAPEIISRDLGMGPHNGHTPSDSGQADFDGSTLMDSSPRVMMDAFTMSPDAMMDAPDMAAAPTWMSDYADPGCVDGQWDERRPRPDVDLLESIRGYQRNDPTAFILEVLELRYPLGRYLVREGLDNGAFDDCVGFFLRDQSSGEAVILQLSTIVHECGHSADLGLSGFSDSAFLLTEDIRFQCQRGDTTTRGGDTFARSRLVGDRYSQLRPPCRGNRSANCDGYADVYLDGDPDDNTFDSGDQGFNSVLEEVLQYVNSLATGYAVKDFYRGSRSERDGILTFLWYLQRYLQLARLEYPSAYQRIAETPCWREAILSIWGRAWLYLELTDPFPELGIHDVRLLELVTDSALLEEIERLRVLQGCQR